MKYSHSQLETCSTASDLEIVRRVLAGETGYFELLMRRYNNRLFRTARAVLNDHDEAMDVVQESWVAAYYALDTFRGPQGFGAWVTRIAHNNALMRLRKQGRIELSHDDKTMEKIVSDESNSEPHGKLAQNQLAIVLEQEVENLPVTYRSVFVLRAIQQLSTRETADSLDLAEDVVKQRYLRARRKLRESLISRVEGSGLSIWEFAGVRCDRIVARVFAAIAEDTY